MRTHINPYSYRKNQSNRAYILATSAIGTRLSGRQKPCFPYALSCRSSKVFRLDLKIRRRADGHDAYISELLGETLRVGRYPWLRDSSWSWSQANNGLFGRRNSTYRHRERQTKCKESQGCMATGYRQRSFREHIQSFFIRIGARYRRIRKRPRVLLRRSSMRIRPRSCKNSKDRQTMVL